MYSTFVLFHSRTYYFARFFSIIFVLVVVAMVFNEHCSLVRLFHFAIESSLFIALYVNWIFDLKFGAIFKLMSKKPAPNNNNNSNKA